ncbi:hypothetical protein DRP53_08890 [candidate division WOR-3 bacterium]|uniref:Peptidase M48 domain-containing protein n=1 Tax=candidate division WOR-3 bacterium TaxID=2052148 RepID=A0A660SEJ0_UNCW3|nr:MAG: hypothetical protein DRP53_08890 [candidate division WOR-3 bacterium]
MASTRTFWEIEEEKTQKIYLLFAFLILLYFLPILIIWTIIKFIIFFRQSLVNPDVSFSLFGVDTILVIIVAAILSYYHWRRAGTDVVARFLKILGAKPLDPHDEYHHIYQNIVDEIATAAGGIEVDPYIIPTGAMNAFSLADNKGKNIIGITEGLLARLTRDELQSVVAHEMAHIVSKDCSQTTMTCALFSLYCEIVARSSQFVVAGDDSIIGYLPGERQRRDAARAASIFISLILFVTNLGAQLLSLFISREREYRADAAAIRYTRNPVALARALYKIGTRWRGAGCSGEYLAPIFILNPLNRRIDEEESFWATLFSTHPPLLKRIRIILGMAHEDLSTLTQLLKQPQPRKVESDQKIEPRYWIEKSGKWQGPYTVRQLMTLEYLRPTTRLRADDRSMSALDLPELRYFFKKREEPFWKIRRLCPDCREWLLAEEYEGVYIWRCAFCDGYLVEESKLPRILVRKDRGFGPEIRRTARHLLVDSRRSRCRSLILDMSHPRRCPKCGDRMIHKLYSYAYHIAIDYCPTCKLIWFDPGELEILQCLIEMEESA